jgi:hypothetical protein
MSVSLARDVSPVPFTAGPAARSTNGATVWRQALVHPGSPLVAVTELWTITPHHPHLDAPSHDVDDLVYPGVPVPERVGPDGVHRGRGPEVLQPRERPAPRPGPGEAWRV